MSARLFFHSPAKSPVVRLRSTAALFALGGGTEENIYFIVGLVGLCCAAAVLLALFSWRAMRARRMKGEHKDEVLEALTRAMEQRSRMDIFPIQRGRNANAPTLSGRCVACSPESLQLECELTSEQPNWPFATVDVFFTEKDAGQAFYAFTASILKTAIEGNRLLIDMLLPSHLRRQQKRAMFRIALAPHMLQALAIWPMDEAQELLGETTGRELGSPLYAYRPQRLDQAAILDISAGGVRLRFDSNRCRQLQAMPKSGDTFIMLIILANPQSAAKPRQFWFKCLCRHIGIPADSNDPVAGMQFRAWSLTEQLTDAIVWYDLGEHNEVPPLLEWLMDYAHETRAS